MEPISTLLALATNYILKDAEQSKAAGTAKEEFLSSFWKWIRPLFIQDVPEVET